MENKKHDIQAEITESIIASIEAGAGKFELPWQQISLKLPVNMVTGRNYHGINLLVLLLRAQTCGFRDNRWATFKQWLECGATVRKGQRGVPVIFYKLLVKEAASHEADTEAELAFPLMRHSYVFNAAQVEGFAEVEREPTVSPETITPITRAEQVVAQTGAVIGHEGQSAYYRISTDDITMPALDLWHGSTTSTPTEAYYSTLFHELVHWTGAVGRMNRFQPDCFGEAGRAQEELVAELGAAFMCVDLGITQTARPDHAAYIAQFVNLLKSDKRAIFRAAGAASKAVEYIMTPRAPPKS